MKRICWDCGAEYSPNVVSGGRMPKGYKVCPKCKSTKTREYKRPAFKGLDGATRGHLRGTGYLGTVSDEDIINDWRNAVRMHGEWCAV